MQKHLPSQPEQTLVYKHCTIFYSCTKDTIGFFPSAAILWNIGGGSSVTCFLRSGEIYPSEAEAGHAALEAAKTWVDIHNPPL